MAGVKKLLLVDIETFSSEDISKTGVFKYVEAPDFEILLLAYAWDDEPVRVIDLTTPDGDPDELVAVYAAIQDPDVVKVAHNSAFERACLSRWLGRDLPPEEWEDTMVLAAMNGLPMSLDAAGAALHLENQKIKEGTSLINYFCKPCRATIANGGRTRNLPEHALDKWERFKAYCQRDVEVEQAIYYRLRSYPVTDFERLVWVLDARINERGVLVDTELAEAAIAVDEAFTTDHSAELQRLTGLDNPNSVAQLKEWLTGVGLEADSLNKAAVKDLRDTATDPTTRRVLELRQLLGKTSTKKYQAMLAAACEDNRVRGIMQYYGAGRTGRWAGRIVQPQNLPQNHLDHIDTVREIVRSRDLEALEMLYDNVPDVLSQLIRTALIARPGHTLLVADYSAIEARVIAYLAGEQWRMEVFAQGGDIYCSSASAMFKVPVEKHGINGHLRQKGKIAELACIAEGQLVLTDCGLVPIEQVTTKMQVWDGIEWVKHDGVVYKGEREALTYGGLEATADHIVWATVNGKTRKIYFGDAAASGAHLLRTGAGENPLRLGGSNQPRETVEREMESLLCADQVQWLREDTVAEPRQLAGGEVQGVPELLSATSRSTKVKVYDILNAGTRHCFTVSDVLVHNCGYGGGVAALKAFGADRMGLTEEEMQDIVTQWRLASPAIPRFWREAEQAAKRALSRPGTLRTIPCCGIGYRADADALRCILPSGRVLSYWGAWLDTDGSICFMGQNQTTRKWEKTSTWGGKLVENIVQAYARDCLATAMVRLAREGYNILFHVHDEIICEEPKGRHWEDMAAVMSRPIDWAPGLLLTADGYETPFYKKD